MGQQLGSNIKKNNTPDSVLLALENLKVFNNPRLPVRHSEPPPQPVEPPAQAVPPPRDLVLDVLRGLLIICVVLGHTSSPYNALVYSFHMPAWFILSGWLHRNRGARELVSSKLATLMVPYLAANFATWALLFSVSHRGLYQVFQGAGAKPVTFEPLELLFTRLQPLNPMMGATWFLPVLFGVSLLAALMIEGARRLGLRSHVLLLGSLGLMACGKAMGWTNYFIDLIFFCQFFYFIGYLAAQSRVRLDGVKTAILALVALGALAFQYLIYNQFYNIAGRRYNSVALLILFTCAGTYLLYLAARYFFVRIPYIREILAYTGRRSIYILLFHFYGFKSLSVCLDCLGYPREYIYSFPTPGKLGYPYWYFYIVWGIAFALLAGYLFDRIYRFALGLIAPRDTTLKSLIHDFLFKNSRA